MTLSKIAVNVKIADDNIFIVSKSDIIDNDNFSDVVGNRHASAGFDDSKNIYHVIVPAKPLFAWMLRHTLRGCDISAENETLQTLKQLADKVPNPYAKLSDDKKRLEIVVPLLNHYRDLMKKVDASVKPQGRYTVPVSRSVELYTSVEMDKSKYPKLSFSEEAEKLFKEPIPGFDGSIESLKNISVDVLNIIQSDNQSWKQYKANKKSLFEKFQDHGIENLHQLLFEIPHRYIDKSNPQKVQELEVGQNATVIGTVLMTETFNSGKGLNVELDLTPVKKKESKDSAINSLGDDIANIDDGFTSDATEIKKPYSNKGRKNTVRVSFFAGAWMQNKFKEGSEVIVTGKYKPWRNIKQISGDTIEFIDSASALPVTPVYPQSEKKGITTQIVMRSVQELISRLGDVQLPFYLERIHSDEKMREKLLKIDNFDENFKDSSFQKYADLIRSVHFPQSMGEREKAMKQLAFYELVEMQIVIQARRHEAMEKSKDSGLAHTIYSDKAYNSALNNLPFSLTGSQKEGIEKISKGMEKSSSWQGMMSADVGSGKTITATLASLVAIDSGYQAAFLAPTEILARQLYESFCATRETLDDSLKEGINIVFFTGSMKAKEKREILAQIKSGEVNVIVSTQAALTGKMEFHNLGFVAIDEQQKFGAEQRSALLTSRNDGKIPDILQMTATPIPRSTAQAVYGDIDFIQLADKPAGRLPIETEWIEEPPLQVAGNHLHRIWDDVKKEISQGRKAFVIAPLVEESEKIDASSVERTYRQLSDGAFTGLNVGFVHGKMKSDEARQKMLDFKNGVFDVLVASTIIEVGVDVPSATRVVILSADRLGASSLHQIRGRVGRNSLQSKCYLVAYDTTDDGAERLQSLVDSNNGFEIAKNDLAIRSEGTLFGKSQSGKSEFIFLKFARHGRWITKAADAAKYILDQEDIAINAVEVCSEKFGYTGGRLL